MKKTLIFVGCISLSAMILIVTVFFLNTRFIPVLLRNDGEPLTNVVLQYKHGSQRVAHLSSGELQFIIVPINQETSLTLSFKDKIGNEHQSTGGYIEPGYVGFFEFHMDKSGAIHPIDSIKITPLYYSDN